MFRTSFFYAFLFLFFVFSLFSYNIEKKYYGNIAGGGREKILDEDGLLEKNVSVVSRNISVELFERYAKVNIIYKIKNNSSTDKKIVFLYPYLVSSVIKSIEDLTNDSFLNAFTDIQKIEGVYADFLVKEDNENVKFQIENFSDDMENNLPFRIGDSKISFQNNLWYKEVVDSFSNKYGYYSFGLDFKKKEVKTLAISYTTKNYYNEVLVKNYTGEDDFEDPALEYETVCEKNGYVSTSDKIFSFILFTPYDKDTPMKNTVLRVASNLIDEDYLKIQPTNYKKSGTTYIWNYRSLKPKQLHNVLFRINRKYAFNSVNIWDFGISPKKQSKVGHKYYEVDKEMILEYKPETDEEFTFSEMRIMPEIYSSKSSVLKSNKIIELEIWVFDKEQRLLRNVTKIISQKDYLSLLDKKNFITIYKESDIKCKSIKIYIRKTSSENEKIIINDIEILK